MGLKKTVLLTGSTGGFGMAIAQKFAAEGWSLILQGRSAEKMNDLTKTLPQSAQFHTFLSDVTDHQSMKNELESLPENYQNIDLLINNAGLALGLENANECNFDDWSVMIDVNVRALTFLTRQILPGMIKRKSGHIINIGSMAGTYPYPGGNVYGATKAFVKQFSLNLRADLHGTGIRVSNIEPGMAETDFSKVRFKGDEEKADSVYEGANALQAEDIANTVYWTASCPSHMNINSMEIMPTTQAFGPLPVYRD